MHTEPNASRPASASRVAMRRKTPNRRRRSAGIVTFADLFCGIGGFHYAAAEFGLKCVFASDIDEGCQRQYECNFGICPVGDIEHVRSDAIPDHDILFGGFPCQPFSIIGNREGISDARGGLVFEVARVLRDRQPRAFILENVKQLASHDSGKTMSAVLRALNESGYECKHKTLNALRFGLPQKRERVIIVGFRHGDTAIRSFEWPDGQATYRPLSEILEPSPPARYFASERIRTRRRESLRRPPVKPAIWHENKGGNISSHPFSCALRAGASYNYLLVNGERRLTPREQLRLQGFPENFEIVGNDSQVRKQTGNAVPVPMVQAVIERILHAAR